MFGTKTQPIKSGPPARAPIYSEPLLGDEAFLDPEQALRLFCHQLKAQIEISRRWLVGSIEFMCPDVVLRDNRLSAQFMDISKREIGTLSVELEGQWIRLEFTGATFKQQFYAERVYEDWELWPAGSAGMGDAPGQIGKRMQWAQIEAKAWPALDRLAGNGTITVEAAS